MVIEYIFCNQHGFGGTDFAVITLTSNFESPTQVDTHFNHVKRAMLMKNHASLIREPLVLASVDLVLINAGFVLAFMLRFGPALRGNRNFIAYLTLAPILSITAVILLYICNLYNNWIQRSLTETTYSLFIVSISLAALTMCASFWLRLFDFPRSVVGIALSLHIVLLTFARSAVVIFLRSHFGAKRVLIVANTIESAAALAVKLAESAPGWYVITHWLLASELNALDSHAEDIDLVAVTADVLNRAEVARHAVRYGKGVLIAPRPYELTLFGAEPYYVDDCMMLSIEQHRLTGFEMLIKRAMDLVISIIAITVLTPVILTLCILIPLESRGPAIFKQERVGRDGKLYQVWKFRTMAVDAERLTGPVLAMQDDPRITRLGALLRSTRLDEIPQFFNVLKGDMSIVGPRPERLHFVRQFEQSVPGYSTRFVVKPGITGLAQVMGRYDTNAERKLRFDLTYIYKYSILLDVKILFQTLRVILHREQASGIRESGPVDTKSLYPLHGISVHDQ